MGKYDTGGDKPAAATETVIGALYLLLWTILFQWQIVVGRRRGTLDFAA